MRRLKLIVILAGAIVLANTAVSAQDRFESNGPYDDATSRVYTTNDGVAYAVTASASGFRSYDDGKTWIPCGKNANGFGRGTLGTLAIDSAGAVYAVSWYRGWITRSTDRGASWSGIANGVALDIFGPGSVESSRPGVVLFTIDMHNDRDTSIVYRTTNGGDKWVQINIDSGSHAHRYKLTASIDGTLLAGTDGAIWKSTDDGASWSNSLTPLNSDDSVTAVLLDATGNAWAYASPRGSLFRSTDEGSSWALVDARGLPPNTPVIRFARAKNGDLFCVTSVGILRSVDRGESWTVVKPRPSGMIGSVDVAAANTGTVFCIVDDLYRSVDDGDTWSAALEGKSDAQITAASRTVAGTILAGTYASLFRSVDRGETWTRSNAGLGPGEVAWIESWEPSNVIVSLRGGGLYRSTDDGVSWRAANLGIAADTAFSILHVSGTTLMAATNNGVYRSTDDGGHWEAGSGGIPTVHVVAIAKGDSGVLLAGTSGAGVFRSSDTGASWFDANAGLTSGNVLSIFRAPTGSLFVGTDHDGVFRSDDNGVTWSQGVPGAIGPWIGYVARWSTNSAGQIVVGSGAILRSSDYGNSWSGGLLRALNDGLYATASNLVEGLVVDDQGQLFVGTRSARGLQRLVSDSGSVWKRLAGVNAVVRGISHSFFATQTIFATPAGMYTATTDSLSVLRPQWFGIPTEEAQCYAHVSGDSPYIIMGTTHGAYRYNSATRTWTGPDSALADVAVNAVAGRLMGRVLVAATSDGMYRSLDTGLTWKPSRAGLPDASFTSVVVTGTGAVVVASLHDGMFRSDDDGVTWRNSGTGLPQIGITALAVIGANRVYAATDGAGIYVSNDDGSTWSPTPGTLADSTVTALAVNYDGLIFAGTTDGVWRSVDGGATWERVIPQLRRLITTISVKGNGRIFVGYDSGVYYSTTADQTGQASVAARAEDSTQYLTIAPNPVHGSFSITYGTDRSGTVSLALYDLLGRRIQIIDEGMRDPGRHVVTCKSDHLSRGTYFLRLEAPDFSTGAFVLYLP